MEEMKRQEEIDMMYQIMQKNAQANDKRSGNDEGRNNITFDYEGKIIQIVKPNEQQFPETITNPKIKFKQAIVQSNYMKEQLALLNKMREEKAKSKKSNSLI